MAAILTEDLIVEILSWVPVKSLMRFRCVSKSWNSLIFHPAFVKLHLQHQRASKNTHLLLRCRRDSMLNLSDEFIGPCSIRGLLENPSSTVDDACHQLHPGYFFIGSCNGLVSLLYHSRSLVRNGSIEYRVRFWNPATRIMSLNLSHLTFHSSQDHDPGFGFGYDDLSDTYKVVLLLLDIKTNNWEVRVHCLGDTDTCWRNTVTVTCPDFPLWGGRDGKLVSGTLNWLAVRWETDTVNQLVIFSYDLNMETYKYLLLPGGLSEHADNPSLGVLKGCLCLYHGQEQVRTRFVVWLMREFGVENSWTPWLNMSFELVQLFPPWQLLAAPLCMFENDDVMLLANYPRSQYIFYNRRDNRIVRAEDFNDKVPLFSHDDYVQSLVLPYRN